MYIYIDACVGVQSATRASGMASVARASGYKYIYIYVYIGTSWETGLTDPLRCDDALRECDPFAKPCGSWKKR